MKALTLNIHSHYRNMNKLLFHCNVESFSKMVLEQDVDIIALQECSQTHKAVVVHEEQLRSFVAGSGDTVIKDDNCAYLIVKKLRENGKIYEWTWCAPKLGYDYYDEGMAIISKYPILQVEEFYSSKLQDYFNWKTRKIIGIKVQTEQGPKWVYSIHMGWWDDEEEPFIDQMERIKGHIEMKGDPIFLMGDFNSDAGVRNEGYDYVKNLGWFDTYHLAEMKDDGSTVIGNIDGWEGKEVNKMRIDHIWINEKIDVKESRVVFSGESEPVISDHYGVMITI